MKTLILILFPFLLFAQTIWYVDRDSLNLSTRVVDGDGTSWGTAYKRVQDLYNNETVVRGDTILISGGLAGDSTTYAPDGVDHSQTGGSSGYIVIKRAWESGHNGDVWFVRTTGVGTAFAFEGNSHMMLQDVNLAHFATTPGNNYVMLFGDFSGVDLADSCKIDNCYLVSNGYSILVRFNHTAWDIVSNCYMETLDNSYDESQEFIYDNQGRGGCMIIGNTFIGRSTDPENGSDHIDYLQIAGTGTHVGTVGYDYVIANNFFYNNRPDAYFNAFAYGGAIKSNRIWIYNNIIALKTSRGQGWSVRGSTDSSDCNYSLRMFNNTFVTDAPDSTMLPMRFGVVDSLWYYNNIVDVISASTYNILFDNSEPPGTYGYSYLSHLEIDNNYYNNQTANAIIKVDGTEYTLPQWQGYGGGGYDNNTYFGSISYSNLWDSVDIGGYSITAGRDLGADLSAIEVPDGAPPIDEDILGNPRGKGAGWDMGAIEFQGVTSWIPGLK